MDGSEDAAAYENEYSASEDSTDGDSEEDIYDDEVTEDQLNTLFGHSNNEESDFHEF